MTPAQSNVAAFTEWLRTNSRARPTPLTGPTNVGRFAVIVPTDLHAVPMPLFENNALPLYVPREQALGVDTGPIVREAPDRLDRVFVRLTHLLWKVKAKALPECRVVGLNDGRLTLLDVMERKGIANTDLTSTMVVFTPLWSMSSYECGTIISKFGLL